MARAIKRGLLRIFPNWQGIPVSSAIYALGIISLLTVYGCASTRPVLVREVQRDTIYISNVQHDSVYLNHELFVDRSKDTVYIRDISVQYKYRLLRDTVRVIQRDSIPFEVVRIETKELTRPLTWYDHLTRLTFWFLIGSLLTFIIIKLNRVF